MLKLMRTMTVSLAAATAVFSGPHSNALNSDSGEGSRLVAAETSTEDRSFPGCSRLSENNSTGRCVIILQNYLNIINPGYNLRPNGIFGSATRIAVLDFQGDRRKHPGVRLGADGIVGHETADELARQAEVKGSVSTPKPGRQLTDEEKAQRCATIGRIPHGADRCISDGVVGMGLSPLECAKELAGAKAYEKAIEEHMSEEAARSVAMKAASKVSAIKTVAEGAKCMFWDIDPEALKSYESVPMP